MTSLLDICSRLGYVFERVSGQNNLIFDVCTSFDSNSRKQCDPTYKLLAKEVTFQLLVLSANILT